MFKFMSSLLALTLILQQQSVVQTQSNCLDKNDNGDAAPTTIHSDLYRGQQAFSVSMLDAIQRATPNENVFFSPYSTYHALLLAYFGAKGPTEQELIKALNLDWAKSKNHVSKAYSFEKLKRGMRAAKMPLEFSSADRVYFAEDIKLDECITGILHEELRSVDFRTKAEQCREDINGWIANVTRNEIPEILSAGDVTPETQLILANAAYFKGKWASQFDPKDTSQEIFYTKTDKQSFVQMMHKRGTYNLATDERLGAHVLEMPYLTSDDEKKESEISMVIILPPFEKDSLEKVLSKLTPETLDSALKDGMAREIDVSFPKFKFEQRLELVPVSDDFCFNF